MEEKDYEFRKKMEFGVGKFEVKMIAGWVQ